MEAENQEEFYENFKKRLEESQTFPSTYLFKFIVPNNQEKVDAVQQVFDKSNAKFNNKESKTGKYVSVNVDLYVTDADQVINYYKEASKIPEIMLL